jgi:Astacin (Peptidase family M12A)
MTDTDMLPACTLCEAAPLIRNEGIADLRFEAIVLTNSRWMQGTEISWAFLGHPSWDWPEVQKSVVRWAFQTWADTGIGLRFREVADPARAMLRIGRLQGDGSWAWVGTQNLRNQKPDGRNMNYGWDLTTAWGRSTALHEIGHAIGMPHEHQNPNAGIVWNEPAVLSSYAAPPNNWDNAKTFANIIRKIDLSEVMGTNWDPTSIMHYPIKPGHIIRPVPYDANGTPKNFTLSPNDVAWVRQVYPPAVAATPLTVGTPAGIANMSGAQSDFFFTAERTGTHILATMGQIDSRVVLVELSDEGEVQLAAADDAGTADTVSLYVELQAGKTYLARVRTTYAELGAQAQFSVN